MKDTSLGISMTLEGLLNQLCSLKEKGYVFRGEASAQWGLKAQFLRENPEKLCQTEEFSSLKNKYLAEEKLIYSRYFNVNRIVLNRIFILVYVICLYNYKICLFQKENLPEVKIDCRDESFLFLEYSKFRYGVGYFIDCLLNGFYPNDWTTFEQGIYQHYGRKERNERSVLIDFSYNPDVALFFSIYLKEGEKIPENIVIYALKEINENNTNIYTLRNDINGGERRGKQEGLFIECRSLNAYYLAYGEWPDLKEEHKLQINVNADGNAVAPVSSQKNQDTGFDLQRFIIPAKFISEIRNYLNKKSIDGESLGLNDPEIRRHDALSLPCH